MPDSQHSEPTKPEAVNFDFSQCHVAVIGASRAGIGASIAHAFKRAGATTHITGMETEPAHSEKDLFPYHQLDVRDDNAVTDFAKSFSSLDVLVNCAGVAKRNGTVN